MLELQRLKKRYGDRLAVDDVSFTVNKGEIVGFLGPNGAGKSTTLRMITGFLEPTSGRVTIDGIDALRHPEKARSRLGYMPEGVPSYHDMRVSEYLRFRAELKGVAGRKISGAVDVALQRAHVDDVADRIIGQLSKGYRQRVGFADALVADPPLLILDEPSSGLDPNQIRGMREVIRGFAGEKTVLLSTHILPEVEATCERVVIIDGGKVVGQGAPGELRSAAQQGQAVRLVGRGELKAFEAALGAVEIIESVDLREDGDLVRGRLRLRGGEEAAEEVYAALADAGLRVRELHMEEASLEDVFTHLTTEDASQDAAEKES